MAFTVEDGTGTAGATALLSVENADAYFTDRGNTTWDGYDDTAKQAAIIRASRFLSDSYAWDGWRTYWRTQELAWPRSGMTDHEGYSIPKTQIPVEIERAVAEVALREAASPGAMTPDYTPADRVKSEKVDVISIEYDLSRTDAESVRPVLLIVRDLIGPFLKSTAGNMISGETLRG